MDTSSIAPCGLDCRLCLFYQRERKPCPGCLGGDRNKSHGCIICPIKNCEQMKLDGRTSCWGCPEYPCLPMKRLEKRYSTKYGASPTANLAFISQHGPEAFLRKVEAEMTCPNCGRFFSMHRWECPSCGHPRVKNS